MTLPIAENIPEIDFNIEGLRRHSLLCVFVAEKGLSETERKIRSWLLHSVFAAARHYSKARDLVVLQNNTDQQRDGGLILHLLDVSEQLEDCVAGVYRSCTAVRRMVDKDNIYRSFIDLNGNIINQLSKVRNQFEHMHSQITSGETGGGPISITFSGQGKVIKFRKIKFDTVLLYELLKGLYQVVASMYSGFDANTAAHVGGPMKLTVTANGTVIPSDKQNG